MLRPPDEIDWHEGMVLLPQHFIDSRLRQEWILHRHLAITSPFHWGLNHFKLDLAALSAGSVRILELEAVMPDGLYVSRFDGDEELTLDLQDPKLLAEAAQDHLTIHLAVPTQSESRSTSPNVVPRHIPVQTSALSDNEPLIPRLRPNLKLLAGARVAPNYSSFPFLKIKSQDKSFILQRYSPPLLRLPLTRATPGVDGELWEMCQDVERLLREKLALLGERMKTPPEPNDTSNRAETRSLIRALSAGFPYFVAHLSKDGIHPYSVYLALCNLLGHVLPLGADTPVAPLQPYDHNRLNDSFRFVARLIMRSVRGAIPENYEAVRFTWERNQFRLLLGSRMPLGPFIIGVRKGPSQSLNQVSAWFESAIICSESRVDLAQSRRVTGFARVSFPGDDELFPTPDMLLYQITPNSESLVQSEPLVVMNPSPSEDAHRPQELQFFLAIATPKAK